MKKTLISLTIIMILFNGCSKYSSVNILFNRSSVLVIPEIEARRIVSYSFAYELLRREMISNSDTVVREQCLRDMKDLVYILDFYGETIFQYYKLKEFGTDKDEIRLYIKNVLRRGEGRGNKFFRDFSGLALSGLIVRSYYENYGDLEENKEETVNASFRYEIGKAALECDIWPQHSDDNIDDIGWTRALMLDGVYCEGYSYLSYIAFDVVMPFLYFDSLKYGSELAYTWDQYIFDDSEFQDSLRSTENLFNKKYGIDYPVFKNLSKWIIQSQRPDGEWGSFNDSRRSVITTLPLFYDLLYDQDPIGNSELLSGIKWAMASVPPSVKFENGFEVESSYFLLDRLDYLKYSNGNIEAALGFRSPFISWIGHCDYGIRANEAVRPSSPENAFLYQGDGFLYCRSNFSDLFSGDVEDIVLPGIESTEIMGTFMNQGSWRLANISYWDWDNPDLNESKKIKYTEMVGLFDYEYNDRQEYIPKLHIHNRPNDTHFEIFAYGKSLLIGPGECQYNINIYGKPDDYRVYKRFNHPTAHNLLKVGNYYPKTLVSEENKITLEEVFTDRNSVHYKMSSDMYDRHVLWSHERYFIVFDHVNSIGGGVEGGKADLNLRLHGRGNLVIDDYPSNGKNYCKGIWQYQERRNDTGSVISQNHNIQLSAYPGLPTDLIEANVDRDSLLSIEENTGNYNLDSGEDSPEWPYASREYDYYVHDVFQISTKSPQKAMPVLYWTRNSDLEIFHSQIPDVKWKYLGINQYLISVGFKGSSGEYIVDYWRFTISPDSLDLDSITKNEFDDISPSRSDFDGDGKTDLLVKNSRDFSVSETYFYFTEENNFKAGYGSSNFAKKYKHCATGDFDGDGLSDVVLKYERSGSVYMCLKLEGRENPWWIQDGKTAYHSQGWYNNYTIQGIGDFNGDGQDDIILMRNKSKTFLVCIMNELGPFDNWHGIYRPWEISYSSENWFSKYTIMGIGDLNGDGRDDLILKNMNGFTEFHFTYKNGNGFTEIRDLGWNNEKKICAIFDVDGDHDDDLITFDLVNGYVINITKSDGNGWTYIDSPYCWKKCEILGSGDFDGDGIDDLMMLDMNNFLVFRNTEDGGITWKEKNMGYWKDMEILNGDIYPLREK